MIAIVIIIVIIVLIVVGAGAYYTMDNYVGTWQLPLTQENGTGHYGPGSLITIAKTGGVYTATYNGQFANRNMVSGTVQPLAANADGTLTATGNANGTLWPDTFIYANGVMTLQSSDAAADKFTLTKMATAPVVSPPSAYLGTWTYGPNIVTTYTGCAITIAASGSGYTATYNGQTNNFNAVANWTVPITVCSNGAFLAAGATNLSYGDNFYLVPGATAGTMVMQFSNSPQGGFIIGRGT
jgi:hypothetical protein